MFANTRPLARAVSIGVLGIALLNPDSARAQSILDHGSNVQRQANAQRRDALLNGAAIGAAVGAGIGVAVTHGVRDSDLVFAQYARGALVFAAIGAGVGLGIDALLSHVSPGPTVTPRPISIAPAVWRDFAGVAVTWRW